MPATTLTFQGINRSISDFGQAGACEELINLRPTIAGLVPVKPFSVKIATLDYDNVYVHYAGSQKNYLATIWEDNMFKIKQIFPGGGEPVTLLSIMPDYLNPSRIHFAAMGNIAVFSILGQNDDDQPEYATCAFTWDGDSYNETEGYIPGISASFSFTDIQAKSFNGAELDTDDKNAFQETVSTGYNAIAEQNKDYCFGPVLVAIAFKTKDSKTFWTGQWFYLNPFTLVKNTNPNIFSVGTGTMHYILRANDYAPETFFSEFFETHDEGIVFAKTEGGVSTVYEVGGKLTMNIAQLPSGWNPDTSMLQSIEIYATKPAHFANLEDLGLDIKYSFNKFIAAEKSIKELDFSNELLYHQASVSLKDLASAAQTVEFKFGGNVQLTNDTLEVDAGMVTRYGNMLSYNARLHYYDSVTRTNVTMPDFGRSLEPAGSTANWNVFAVYDDGQSRKTIYLGEKALPPTISEATIIAPSLKIKEVYLYIYAEGEYRLRKYAMNESSRYNYSYCEGGPYYTYSETTPSEEVTELIGIMSDGITYFVDAEEPDAMNVTEQYNPFVFRVEHSYLAPGKILDVQPQLVTVADISTGTYPLNIFTNRGVYALLQGSGTVLYGELKALSNLVSGSNAVPTEQGTFIIAAGGVWAVMGRHVVLVSDALSLGPHKYIRNCGSYLSISHVHYDIENYESAVDFETFVAGAHFSYNRFRDELIISNTSYGYSYVLSLKYRQWHKISGSFTQDVVGSDVSRSGQSLVDFTDETENVDVLVHLQSRPFSFAYQYSHVHRIVQMIRAELTKGDGDLTVALYGSDNLQSWTLLTYANRTYVDVSQIRTAPAARSWRYYTLCVGGICPDDTDFGPVLVDYDPVVRRLG